MLIEPILVLEQALNGVQFGVMLFLMAAGLTLVFGIMDLVNLAHGALYMIGAYLGVTFLGWIGDPGLAVVLALLCALLFGMALESTTLSGLYQRHHLDQVLATFGLILVFNEAVTILWGPAALYASVPEALSGHVTLFGAPYPVYRLVIIGVGLAVALGLGALVSGTRLGMLIRAGASNRDMLMALGVDVRRLYTAVFGLGAMLAALAGILAGPLYTVQPGMGEEILILVFVVIVIGGIGSIRGAFVAAMLVGVVDTMGRAFLRPLLGEILPRAVADGAGPALASMLIYLLMAVVLVARPRGLFPARTR